MNNYFICGFEKNSSILGKIKKKFQRLTETLSNKNPIGRLNEIQFNRSLENKYKIKSEKPSDIVSDIFSIAFNKKTYPEHLKHEARRHHLRARRVLKKNK